MRVRRGAKERWRGREPPGSHLVDRASSPVPISNQSREEEEEEEMDEEGRERGVGKRHGEEEEMEEAVFKSCGRKRKEEVDGGEG